MAGQVTKIENCMMGKSLFQDSARLLTSRDRQARKEHTAWTDGCMAELRRQCAEIRAERELPGPAERFPASSAKFGQIYEASLM